MTASKFPQFVRCPRSVLEQPDDIGKRSSTPKNPAALRGTRIHAVIDTYIKSGKDAAQQKSKELDVHADFRLIDFVFIDSFLVSRTFQCSEYSMAGSVSGEFRHIESYDELSKDDVIAGTADLITWNGISLMVLDWKTGLDKIDAQKNEQLMSLAYMFIKAKKIEPEYIELVIACPVTGVNDDLYKSVYICNVDEANATIQGALQKVFKMKMDESAGFWCRYCRFKQNCKSFKEMSDASIQELDVLEAF